MQNPHRLQVTQEGLAAPGHVPPAAGLTSAAATQARARCACWCLLDTLACTQVHAQAGSPVLTLPRLSSLPVAQEAQRNDPQVTEPFLMPTPLPVFLTVTDSPN